MQQYMFPGCCQAYVRSELSGVLVKDLRGLNKGRRRYTYFAIVHIDHQAKELKKLMAHGWKRIGRRFKASRGGNKLQMLVLYPKLK